MQLSVVIITKNEAARLRLCLASVDESLKHLGESDGEVIVVNDGSDDSTEKDLTEAQSRLSLRVISTPISQGRSSARNLGATHARGKRLLFLDGDTMVSPLCFVRHVQAHNQSENPCIFRGEVFHFRQTRFFSAPQTGEPYPEYRTRPLSEDDLISERDIRTNFNEVSGRATPGIYPGLVPRSLATLEASALRNKQLIHPLWMTVTAHNLSVARALFNDVGGFDERFDMNEHRDLALTLQERHGVVVRLVEGAPSYHLCHASRWRDPLEMLKRWEPLFLEKHNTKEARLLTFFWMTLAQSDTLPEGLRIRSIEELIERAQGDITSFEDYRRTCHIFTV